jgi:lipoprotein-anchoring transpeptidase ErfK/SrfK
MMNTRKALPYLIVGGMVALGAAMTLVLLGGVGLVWFASRGEDNIAPRVAIAGIEVGGDTPEEAAAALSALNEETVIAQDGGRTWTLTLAELGVSVDTSATLHELQQARAGDQVTVWYNIDLNRAYDALVALSQQTNIVATTEQGGRMLDVPATLDRLRLDVTGQLADGVLTLPMFEEPPLPVETPTVPDYDGPITMHIVERGQELGLIAQQYGVSVADIVALNGIENPDLLFIGQELQIPAAGIYIPPDAEIPDPPTNNGRAIVVSISQQRIYAFENGNMVHTHLVSTGRPETPTVLGDYEVYVKFVADDMSGPDYFLPQVPYTMYFYRGYAIHGTYWHSAFGRTMSHGCVNLPVHEAQWFFEFASVGTPVRVVQ